MVSAYRNGQTWHACDHIEYDGAPGPLDVSDFSDHQLIGKGKCALVLGLVKREPPQLMQYSKCLLQFNSTWELNAALS